MPTKDANETGAVDRARLTRTFRGKRMPPDRAPNVNHVEKDGKPVVIFELFGRLGEGHTAEVDEADWARVVEISPSWEVISNGHGNLYVTCCAERLAGVARQSESSVPRVTLARALTGAKPREYVVHRDGNPFNLRRGNLEILSHAEFFRRNGDRIFMMDGMSRDDTALLWGLDDESAV